MEDIYTKKGNKLSAHSLTTQRESLNLMIFCKNVGYIFHLFYFMFIYLPLPHMCVSIYSPYFVWNGIPNETVTPDQLITRRNVCLFISLSFYFIICVCYKKGCRALSRLWFLVVQRSILRTCAS